MIPHGTSVLRHTAGFCRAQIVSPFDFFLCSFHSRSTGRKTLLSLCFVNARYALINHQDRLLLVFYLLRKVKLMSKCERRERTFIGVKARLSSLTVCRFSSLLETEPMRHSMQSNESNQSSLVEGMSLLCFSLYFVGPLLIWYCFHPANAIYHS
jgi:hypothetical protein